VHPADFQTLAVSFAARCRRLRGIDQPAGLVAIVTVDRGTSRFLGVKFLNRYTSEQLAEAIAAVSRYGYQPPSWMFSSLGRTRLRR